MVATAEERPPHGERGTRAAEAVLDQLKCRARCLAPARARCPPRGAATTTRPGAFFKHDRRLQRDLDLEVGVLPRRGLEVQALGIALQEVERADQIAVEHERLPG